MATALEILPLARQKLELSIPLAITDDDSLITGHIGAAVDFCGRLTGLDLGAMDARRLADRSVSQPGAGAG